MAVEQPVDEVQIAGPAAASTNGEFTGQVRFGTSRKGSDLLMADVNPLDLALSSHRVGESVEAITDNAIDPFNARCRQDLCELIRYCFRHVVCPLPSLHTAARPQSGERPVHRSQILRRLR